MRSDKIKNSSRSSVRRSKRCIIMDCTNRSNEGTFIGDLCSPCHMFVTSGKGVHSQAYRNAMKIPHRKMVLDLEFLPEKCEGRRGLECLFCGEENCDRLIFLWFHDCGFRRIGIHDACVDRHETVLTTSKIRMLGKLGR